jgi:hypothetical protein
MKAKTTLCFLISLPALVQIPVSAAPRKTHSAKSSIVAKWRVTSKNTYGLRNHTYQFLSDGICIEKYLSDQMVGPIDAPPYEAEVETVTTYRYKYLGGQRYRLYLVKTTDNGREGYGIQTWHVISVKITNNRAVVDLVDRQQTQAEKALGNILSEPSGSSQAKNLSLNSPDKHEIWTRVF